MRSEDVVIRPIAESELPILNKDIRASYGRSHADELNDQVRGLLSFFVGWYNELPIGSGLVSWTGPRDGAVCDVYPGCPEIYRLGVHPDYQSRGVGTRLIQVCEQAARIRGYYQIGLGVSFDNPRAEALYLRLGYTHSSVEKYIDEYTFQAKDGSIRAVQDPLRFLIKNL